MLNVTSLREQVYDHLRQQIHQGEIRPGVLINLDRLSRELGISKTPLKEAIIRLECEGFVEILPRRGIQVKKITSREIKDLYQMLGSLEAAVVLDVFDKFTPAHVETMRRSNARQIAALENKKFEMYYQLNLDFHDIFLTLSENLRLRQFIGPLKQRLYDFPRRQYWKEWERINLDEHERFIRLVERGDREGAAALIRDEHWGWRVHQSYIHKFYQLDPEAG